MSKFETKRRVETKHSLEALKLLASNMDTICKNCEVLLNSWNLDPAAKEFVKMLLTDEMFDYRQEMDNLIKILEEEQVFYGDEVKK